MAQALDLFGVLAQPVIPRKKHRITKGYFSEDWAALAGDWQRVSKDFEKAVGKVDQEIKARK